jgi:hypothetical protein
VARAAPTPGLVESYFQEIRPDLYGAFWMRRRIEAELRDHLEQAVARMRDRGLDDREAEARAIEQLGSPRQVARAFAHSKGVGVPTRFTKWSGMAMIVGTIVFIAALTYQAFDEAFEHSIFGPIATTGGSLVGIGLIGIFVRLRGQLGQWGRTGLRVIFGGCIIMFGSSALWFMPGVLVGLIAMIVGMFAFFIPLWQSDVAPRGALTTVLAGLGLGAPLGFTALITDTEALALLAGAALYGGLVVGLCWLGLTLWSEDPDGHPATDGGGPAATA